MTWIWNDAQFERIETNYVYTMLKRALYAEELVTHWIGDKCDNLGKYGSIFNQISNENSSFWSILRIWHCKIQFTKHSKHINTEKISHSLQRIYFNDTHRYSSNYSAWYVSLFPYTERKKNQTTNGKINEQIQTRGKKTHTPLNKRSWNIGNIIKYATTILYNWWYANTFQQLFACIANMCQNISEYFAYTSPISFRKNKNPLKIQVNCSELCSIFIVESSDVYVIVRCSMNTSRSWD